MKKYIFYAILLLYAIHGIGQTADNGCYNNINTRTTNPKEQNATDGKNPNAIQINGNTNANRFDWTDPTINQAWYWHQNTSIPPATILLPYYCNVSGNSYYNGSCANQNIYYYQQMINNFPSGISLHDRNKAFDILPEDGWELVYKYFGVAGSPNNYEAKLPTFVLYNRYTGRLKVFVAATGLEAGFAGITNTNRAALSVKFPQADRTALFGLAKPISQVVSAYTVSTTQGNDAHFMNNEFVMANSVSQLNAGSVNTNSPALSTPPQYQWLMSEFTVPYDPCTCFNSGGNAAQIEIAIIYWSTSNVDLNGKITGMLNAQPSPYYSGNNVTPASSQISTQGNLTNSLEGAMKGYESWSKYAEAMKSMVEGHSGGSSSGIGTTNVAINNMSNIYYTSTNGSAPTNISQSTSFLFNALGGTNGSAAAGAEKLAGFDAIAKNVASALPYVGAFIGLVDAFYGGGQENSADNPQHVIIDNPPPPTNYDVNLSVQLTGQISTQTKPTPIAQYVPGSRASYNIAGMAPVYNNILGVFNIMEEPAFQKTPIYLAPTLNWTPMNLATGQCYIAPMVIDIPDYVNTNFQPHQFRMSTLPSYALNPASNLQMEGMDAAIVLEYDKNALLANLSNLTTLNTMSMVPYYNGLTTTTNANFETRINNLLAGSGMELEYVSKDYDNGSPPNDAIIRFRTKYVPYECLTSQNFVLYGNETNASFLPKCYLKIYAKLSVIGKTNSDPVIIIQTFDITNSFKNAASQTQFQNANNTIVINQTAASRTIICSDIANANCNGNGSCVWGMQMHVNTANFVVSVNTLPTPNIFIGGSANYNNSYIANMSNITINGDVPKGWIYASGADINFGTSPSSHIIGSATNAGANGNLAKIYAQSRITLNGTFTLMNTTDVRAGIEISIPNTSEADIKDEADLAIDLYGDTRKHLINCTSGTPVTNFQNTSAINNWCGTNFAARPAQLPDTMKGVNPPPKKIESPEVKLTPASPAEFDYSIVPNPTNGNLKVTLLNATELPRSIVITDLLSKPMLEKQMPAFETDLDISDFPAGLYFVKINYKGKTLCKRIVKN